MYLSIFSSFPAFRDQKFQNILSALVTSQKEKTRSEKSSVSRTCNTHVHQEKVVNADVGPLCTGVGSEGTRLSA